MADERIRGLADRFAAKSPDELVNDPEFDKLTSEDLRALADEFDRRGERADRFVTKRRDALADQFRRRAEAEQQTEADEPS